MEQFRLLEGDRTLKDSREQINNALSTVRSLSSGTAFPTTDLSEGMLCYRTDLGRLYQLADAKSGTWTDRIAMNIAGTSTSADSISWANIEKKPTAYPADEHSHLYAGASTAGGSATKADALATSRTINGTPFDGTSDITITVPWSSVENKPASYAAADKLTTARTINGVSFDGTADITIAVPATPKAYVTATWHSGAKWYRTWSDGFIEQGGRTPTVANVSTAYTVTLNKAFTTTTYTIQMTPDWETASGDNGTFALATKSTTKFTFYNTDDKLTKAGDWYACGY